MSIDVMSKVQIYETDGEESSTGLEYPMVTVKSHWNDDRMVIIRVDKGHEVTVLGRHLLTAVENAMRTAK